MEAISKNLTVKDLKNILKQRFNRSLSVYYVLKSSYDKEMLSIKTLEDNDHVYIIPYSFYENNSLSRTLTVYEFIKKLDNLEPWKSIYFNDRPINVVYTIDNIVLLTTAFKK